MFSALHIFRSSNCDAIAGQCAKVLQRLRDALPAEAVQAPEQHQIVVLVDRPICAHFSDVERLFNSEETLESRLARRSSLSRRAPSDNWRRHISSRCWVIANEKETAGSSVRRFGSLAASGSGR